MPTYNKTTVLKLLQVREAPKKKLEYITFYDPGLSINQMREKFPQFFWFKPGNGWYKDEMFANETDTPRTREMSMWIVPGSLGKTFTEQKALLSKGERIPKARELIMGMLLHFCATGEQVESKYWIRCHSQTADSYWVGVDWDGDQINLYDWPGDVHRCLGFCSARDLPSES